ncbi:Poly(A) RNA polymerase, mitochondrial [Holothuria leucospilota]|uniref:Poly(A) RNA polymerase, mitochondrial n=1 Tax=Holothuria leucospilota TaxID=206669 RepID=A0A9Q1C0S4_HOLLE|nr:Poly(A) RNA polymerase, mitochondrial [Holothuria leucospilota]
MAAPMTMFSVVRQGEILACRRSLMSFRTIRACSSVSGTVASDHVTDQEQVPFWNFMEMRRKQADNTILVRLCDKTPLTTLLQFCSSHGKVKHHFSYHQQGRYAYVEFNTAAALQSLLQHTEQNGHNKKTKNTDFIHSRFLTFSRAGKKKEKEKSVLNKQPVHRSLMNKLCQTDSVSEQIDTLMQEEQLREPEVHC